MKLSGTLCLLLLGSSLALSQDIKSQIVGKWRYDVKTLKIALSDQAKKELQKQGQPGYAKLAQLQKGLTEQLDKMNLIFGKDGTFLVTLDGYTDKMRGWWKVSGRQVKITMDDGNQKVPMLELLPGGKKMRAKFNEPKFGSGSVELSKRA